MTFDEWLDEPQTVTTRRERLTHFAFKSLEASPHQGEILLGWLSACWNAGIESKIPIPRCPDGGTPDVKRLTQNQNDAG